MVQDWSELIRTDGKFPRSVVDTERWEARITHHRFGYWISYHAGLIEELGSQWRPTLRWAFRSAHCVVRRRNVELKTWMVVDEP